MNAHDELKHFFRLLRKYENLLTLAYLDNHGVVDDVDLDASVIDTLVKSRLVLQPPNNDPTRLTRELTNLFDRVLRDPRRLTLDADIGSVVNNIEDNVNQYKRATGAGLRNDATLYLNQIENLVGDLMSNLLDSSGQLWEKINSEFGYVSSLELKIKENETVLNQANRLNNSLEIIKVREIDELAGNDYQLRRYLNRWLLDAVELCRRETVDAIHKLNDLLFEYRKQQRIGRLIDSFYQRFQSTPGYRPLDYTDMGEIPDVFNHVAPIIQTGHANIEDPHQEVALTKIISGLRKERVTIEEPETPPPIDVLPDGPPIQKPLAALSQAVENFYFNVIELNEPLSAVKCCPSVDVEPDLELWIYAVIAHFNNMVESERALFKMEFKQTIDPVFNGRYLVQDVHVALTGDEDLLLSTGR